MYHYYFIERNSGEEFIVGADTLEEAWMTAKWVALSLDEDPDLDGGDEMTDEEAEMSGLDEY